MIDDIVNCYYNPKKDEIFLSNLSFKLLISRLKLKVDSTAIYTGLQQYRGTHISTEKEENQEETV